MRSLHLNISHEKPSIVAEARLRVVPHFSSEIVEQAKRERAWKSPHARKGDTRRGERKMRDYRQSPSFWTNALLSQRKTLIGLCFVCSPSFFSLRAACRHFSRGVIFTRARVSLALLSLRKNGGLLVAYSTLGARDFSSAVSGFCQVFIVTRAKNISRSFAAVASA